jgi:mono/diheme cytochrome c family protein
MINMFDRHKLVRAATLLLLLGFLAACAAPEGLPKGPTPIPTLIPVGDQPAQSEAISEASFVLQSYPAQLPSANRGLEIYQELCLECHGPNGTGVVPGARDFRDLDFIRGETPIEFYAAVAEGRNDMPAYSESLSSDERWDVVFYIWRLSTSPGVIDKGSALYSANCSPCHGEDGAGEQLGSANFTDLREMDRLAPRDLYLTITQGRGSMPAWQSLLLQDERWAVIDYLRTFTYDPSLPESLGTDESGEGAGETGTSVAGCDPGVNPFDPSDAQAIQAGGSIYDSQCAACHGADGSGGLPNTPDFTSSAINRDLRANPNASYCALAEGEGAMPGFQRTLTTDQIWQVITFLRSLAP